MHHRYRLVEETHTAEAFVGKPSIAIILSIAYKQSGAPRKSKTLSQSGFRIKQLQSQGLGTLRPDHRSDNNCSGGGGRSINQLVSTSATWESILKINIMGLCLLKHRIYSILHPTMTTQGGGLRSNWVPSLRQQRCLRDGDQGIQLVPNPAPRRRHEDLTFSHSKQLLLVVARLCTILVTPPALPELRLRS